ncbi:choice-of-anchor D domain-containing protein [Sungkyunkwania multivorans]|uniref:Choice-of-anchor D domain-containing protein n=1 Tax=Sungkyunkwania multivorans TaxID=1173618 RepID=A0ABW3CYP2_9FLAO
MKSKSIFAVLFITFFSTFMYSQTTEVSISVTWPNYAEENTLQLYNPSGVLITSICVPTNCYSSDGSDLSYNTTVDLGCLTDGNNYSLYLFDAADDGWDGADNLTVTVGGVPVISGNDGGNASNAGYGPITFNVSGGSSACNAPEIDVLGNSANIVNGDTTPETFNNTDFGSVNVTAGTISKTYTIENDGTGTLTLGANAVTISGSSDFTVATQPAATVAAGSSTSFQVDFDPSTSGSISGVVSINNDDADESPFTFSIAGTGLSATREIAVTGNNIEIVNGDTTPDTSDYTDIGITTTGTQAVTTFAIKNIGATTLNLTGSPLVQLAGSADFSVSLQPSSNIAPGDSSTFRITYTPSTSGSDTALVTILNNDSDESVYSFTIQAEAMDSGQSLYCYDFETGSSGWSATTEASGEWRRGTEGTMSAGANGRYLYSRRYGGNYQDNTDLVIESPSMDFSGYKNVVVKLDVNYETSNDSNATSASTDGMWIEFSNDGGATWYRLGSENEGSNWYNAKNVFSATDINGDPITEHGWSGASAGWLNAQLDMESQSADDQADVRFRVIFRSDAATTDVGIAFDNFCIEADPITTTASASCGTSGIGDGIELWLRADQIPGVNDGDAVAFWPNIIYQDTWTSAFASGSERPTFKNNTTDNVNFNPVVNFDGTNAMYGKKGFYNKEIFIVVNPTNATNYQSATQDVFMGDDYTEVPNTQDVTGISIGNTSARFNNDIAAYNQGPETKYGKAIVSTFISYDKPVLFSVRENEAGDGVDIFFDGLNIDSAAIFGSQEVNKTSFKEILNSRYWLGRSEFFGASFEGDIMEIITFSERKSESQRKAIESILAVKYGITLGIPGSTISYVDTEGNDLWDGASISKGFDNNVAGIGRDDCTFFQQKQSKSIDENAFLTVGLGDLYDTNADNPNNFADNRDFLMWGSTNATLTTSAIPLVINLGPTTVTTITDISERKWKFIEHATTDITDVKVSVDSARLTGLPTLTGNDAYVMIVADDENFTSNIETVFTTSNGSLEEAYYDFDGTKYVAFGVAHEVKADRHLTFDGINDYTRIGNKVELAGAFSAMAWVNTSGSNSTSSNKTIVAKKNASVGYSFYLQNDNRIAFEWTDSSNAVQKIVSNTALNNNVWRHAAVTYDGTETKLFIDGVLDNTLALNAPAATTAEFSIGANYISKNSTADHFTGNIDEVILWSRAITVDELRFIMNQEIQNDGSGTVEGKIIPSAISKNDISGAAWTDLIAYYDMNSYIGTHLNDVSGNANRGSLVVPDRFSIEQQTAPLPYVSSADGSWTDASIWNYGNTQYTPNAKLTINGVATDIDWNIVQVGHNVYRTEDTELLGLISTGNELTISNDSGLTISHYLRLDGTIDLEGESQMIQTLGSDLDVASTGTIEQDQQGTADSYTYNYWSVPVSLANAASNNNGYTIADVLRDGTTASNPQAINFNNNYAAADGALSSPITLSTYWMYKFNGPTNDYNSWVAVGNSGSIQTGEGFTMKGSGAGSILQEQNYVFTGKPNNADISLPLTAGYDYLVGNPYASAIDGRQFITDNPATSGVIYLWEHWGGGSHQLADYQGGYAMVNLSGEVQATSHPDVSQAGASVKTPSRYLAVGQGFFVTGSSNGTVNFNNGQRANVKESSGNSVFLRNRNDEDSQVNRMADDRRKFRIGFDAPSGLHRQLLLTIDENATFGVDFGYDGRNLDNQIDDMFWTIENGDYIIQGIPSINDDTILPLGIITRDGGEVTIGIDALENISSDTAIYLEDKLTGTITDLRLQNVTTNIESGDVYDRFQIIFSDQSLSIDDQDLSKSGIDVYHINDSNILKLINNGTEEIDEVTIFNMLGQVVRTWKVTKDANVYTTIGLTAGTYIARVSNGKGEISKKFIVE